MNKITVIITALRKEKNWSQTDLANQSRVSREMISKMKPDFKVHLFSIIDSVIRDYKTQQAYTS